MTQAYVKHLQEFAERQRFLLTDAGLSAEEVERAMEPILSFSTGVAENTLLDTLEEAVKACCEGSVSPNLIIEYVEHGIRQHAKDWAEYGDGQWRQDTCCPVCGSWAVKICGHHQRPILRREYEARQSEGKE